MRAYMGQMMSVASVREPPPCTQVAYQLSFSAEQSQLLLRIAGGKVTASGSFSMHHGRALPANSLTIISTDSLAHALEACIVFETIMLKSRCTGVAENLMLCL